MAYDNTNRGVAFTNDYKKEDRHPDFKGNGNFAGVDFEIGIWEKEKDGKPYLSFSFSEPYKKDESGSAWEQQREKFATKDTVLEDISDEPIDLSEIPF